MAKFGFKDGKIVLKNLTVEKKMPVEYTLPMGVNVSSTYLVEGWNVTATAAKTNLHLKNQPPYPVELSVHAVVAGGTAGVGVLKDKLRFRGYDAKGNVIVEDIYVSTVGGTGAGAYKYSNNAFSKITSIVPLAAGSSTDVNIGFRNVIGLPYKIDSASDILSAQVGNNYATSGLTVDTVYDNVSMPSGFGAGSTAHFVWLSKVQ